MMKKILTLIFLPLFIAILVQGCDKKTPTPITVTDIDGNVYNTITVGTQIWTTENLRTTRYNDGAAITTGLNNTDWASNTTGAYAIYNDDASNNTTYGKLYNWSAVNTGKLAPEGWHVATEADYGTLIDNLGGSSVAGGKMKMKSSLWQLPNAGATDMTSFYGLPGGYRGTTGSYAQLGKTGYWWANTERNTTQGEYLSLDNDFASTNRNGATKSFGYSVRCVKN